MRRQCGRPGCSAVATVTFTFDATKCVVWLDDIADGMARAGDLCTRHANSLVPPKGWDRVDRRIPTAVPTPPVLTVVPPVAPAAAPAVRRPRRDPADDASLFDAAPAPAPAPAVVAEPVAPAPVAPAEVSWLPRNVTEEELDSVLSASSPLLSRAFRNARGDGGEPDPDDGVDPDAF